MDEVLDRLIGATSDLCTALDTVDLDLPSRLPGWSGLTIACHLRYGAAALRRMAADVGPAPDLVHADRACPWT